MRGLATRVALTVLRFMRMTNRKRVSEQQVRVVASMRPLCSDEPALSSRPLPDPLPPLRWQQMPEQSATQRIDQCHTGPEGDVVPPSEINLQAWSEQCSAMAEAAFESSALSHDWCVELYSESVDRALLTLPQTSRLDDSR